MISDEYLVDIFARELRETQDVRLAMRHVRLTIELEMKDRRYQRNAQDVERRPGEGGSRGPVPVTGGLTEGEEKAVIALVAAELNMSVELLREGSSRDFVHARWVVAGVLRHFGMSYPQIARAVGMGDHTGALYAVRTIRGYPPLVTCRDQVIARLEAQGWGKGKRRAALGGKEAA